MTEMVAEHPLRLVENYRQRTTVRIARSTFVLAAQAGWAKGNPDTSLIHPYWGCDQAAR